MTDFRPISKRLELAILGVVLVLFAAISVVGITWGLPTRNIDKHLFRDGEPWTGEKIYRLAGAAEKLTPDRAARRGADVDIDPLEESGGEPVLLTGTEEDVAKIYLRYRLYTYQPDEMITMMALAGMRPRSLQLDPRLYQYGGLFIYPVGALIGACGALGLIDVRGDVVYYLDNPDEFGKFYVVARAYSAAWGLLGVAVVFAIARRLAGSRAGLLAALLFAVMPVVVCMAHEGKPHLPGAVLMLLAVLFAMRCLSPRGPTPPYPPLGKGGELRGGAPPGADRDFWLMCVCCGAAFGMVLSSWPIFVLIPLVAWLYHARRAASFSLRGSRGDGAPSGAEAPRGLKPAAQEESDSTGVATYAVDGEDASDTSGFGRSVSRVVAGIAIGIGTYLITNPYIVINAFVNREVLRSNFGNSLAMYEVARIGEGFVRVFELTVEGATLPVLMLGTIALIVALVRRGSPVHGTASLAISDACQDLANSRGLKPAAQDSSGSVDLPLRVAMLPLAVPAVVFFLQFVMIGAGKPAEYGRFGIFTNTALVIGAACLLTRRWIPLREIVNWIPATFVIIWVAFFGAAYLRNFHLDAAHKGTRALLAGPPGRHVRDTSTDRSYMSLAVLAEPAPYNYPPVDFSNTDVIMYASDEVIWPDRARRDLFWPKLMVPADVPDPAKYCVSQFGQWERSPDLTQPIVWDRLARMLHRPTPISWANKPFLLGEVRTDAALYDGTRRVPGTAAKPGRGPR